MKEGLGKRILLAAGVSGMLLFCLAPFGWMVAVSLARHPDFLGGSAGFALTMQNYSDVLAAHSFHLLEFLRNSIIVSAVAAVVATVFATLSAYAITRMNFPGKVIIPVVLLAFSMFPQISIVGYLFKFMIALGWINTYYALILPYIALGLPLALWIMLSYLSQLSTDLDKAALVDGATRLQILRSVIFPVALPGLVSTMLLVFIYSFNEFLFALMLTIDYRARTVPVGIALFEGLHGQIPWGYVMAAAVIATIPLILLAAFFQKHIIQGLTQGALKG